eukprot:gnl/TRDRNA2_/TRDRNA2_191646_c0_seq1.p1 gnl/TRDRNA2_/TRDRNA2_191646_c0~~gnl/TRDRNA2_/TRDRNA2_191646_c0_seq1.p1  ORF type:complete len:462 (+),score=126.17 gnl/TRDRNA2_/TRDRNA2_191646_c0_seq1:27-1388(+)
MTKVVRDSKFRHVFGEASKQKYEDLRLSTKTTESTGIRGNSKLVAIAWESGGGGTLAVFPSTKFGRMAHDMPLITGHSGAILDFEFNPFDDNMLITASEDLTMKLWSVPDEGLKQHLKEPLCTLEGHGKKVSFSTFNRSAANIVASASFDLTCRVWNLTEQEEAFKIEVPEQVMALKWNYTGHLLAATCKDKKMRIIDPRQKAIAATCKIHEGVKASKVEWIGSATAPDECNKIITTGFSQQAERQVGIWDMRHFDQEDAQPLNLLVLDQGTGALFPTFDEGTNMLYIAGKGDGNVRYFEMTSEDPYLHYISQFGTTTPQKGFDFLPKRCMNTSVHEIMRGLKLESTAIQPIFFKVPRKSEAFQEDLYPACQAGVPAMSADDWCAGAEAKIPVNCSMKPGESSPTPKAQAASASVGVVSVKDLKKQLADAQAKIQELEKENAALKAEVATLKG